MTPKKLLFILIAGIVSVGCTKDVDFDQIDDARIKSEYIVTLAYLDFESVDFLDDVNPEIPVQTDAMENPLKSSTKVDLVQADFTIKTTNTFNRNFRLTVAFYDDKDEIFYSLDEVFIPAMSEEVETPLTIPESDIDVLFEAEKIGFEVVIEDSTDGSVISPNVVFNLNIQSAVKLYFNFKTQ